MKIAVISDTHGTVKEAEEALAGIGEFDGLLHAGDFYEDFNKLKFKFRVPIAAGVRGNCDPDFYPRSLILELLRYKILLIHGHQYNVKYSLNALKFAAKEAEVDIVVFGHTHVSFSEEIEGTLFFNPGSVLESSNKPSIGVIELGVEEKTIDAKIVYL